MKQLDLQVLQCTAPSPHLLKQSIVVNTQLVVFILAHFSPQKPIAWIISRRREGIDVIQLIELEINSQEISDPMHIHRKKLPSFISDIWTSSCADPVLWYQICQMHEILFSSPFEAVVCFKRKRKRLVELLEGLLKDL